MSPTASHVADVTTGLLVRESGHPVPLEHVRVEAQVTDLTARVSVHQAYRNLEGRPIEVVYVFPLDEGAAVCGFEATVDGVHYVGQVTEREEAFRRYDDALEAGHGGFLLDEERADVFTASLGNVQPGSRVVLSITYVTELSAEGGTGVRFTLPTTVSPRYAPEADREGVSPTPNETLNPPVELDVPYAFTVEMRVAMNGRIRTLTSPSHPIEVEHDGANAIVRLAQRSAPMDRDLVVVIAADGLSVPHAVVEKDERGGGVMLSFVPAFDTAEQPADVVFVVDRSGSMEGTSILEVRNALQLCLRSLTPGCHFNIVSFGSTYSTVFPTSHPYDESSMKEASAFVETLEADMGGTEMLPALEFVLGQQAQRGLPRQVLLLTDGEVTNTDEVIDVARRHAPGVRFFTFGIGAGASQHLVRGIARASGGAAEFIAPGERIEAKVMRQFRRVLAPALTDVKVAWGQRETVAATDVVPPVFAGERLIVYALGAPTAEATATLSGRMADRGVSYQIAIDPATALSGGTVATLAARARIRQLEEQAPYLESRGSRQCRARGKAVDASAEIVALGVKYQLCSRETSFVAIEHREAPTAERAELRRVPVALTSGWGGIGAAKRQSQARPAFAARLMAAPMSPMSPMPAPPYASSGDSYEDADAIMECRSACYEHSEPDAGPSAPPDWPGASFLGVSARPERVARRPHDVLVALQAADGSWDLTPEFAQAIGKDFDTLMQMVEAAAADPGRARRALATSLALAWLESHAPSARDEWGMLAGKANRWLAGCAAGAPGGASWLDFARRRV
jgi:Ca-activated chloride channel homolog